MRGGLGRGEGGARDRSDHGEGRAGAGQCPSCGLDCGTTSGLYRHVVVRCLDQLGQSIEEFKRKFQLRRKRARWITRATARWAAARAGQGWGVLGAKTTTKNTRRGSARALPCTIIAVSPHG